MLLPNAVEEAQELARKLEEDRAWLAALPPKVLGIFGVLKVLRLRIQRDRSQGAVRVATPLL